MLLFIILLPMFKYTINNVYKGFNSHQLYILLRRKIMLLINDKFKNNFHCTKCIGDNTNS